MPGKRELVTAFQTRLLNPFVRRAIERGVCPPGWAVLETTGRRSGLPRRTPVGDGRRGDTFWIVAEHGRRAGYVRNIEANPCVRVLTGGRWRTGTARTMPDDDPLALRSVTTRYDDLDPEDARSARPAASRAGGAEPR